MVPFEAADTVRYGNTYKGMQQYIAAMDRYEPTYTYNGVAFQGWQSAALIAAGIRAAGNDVTQATVVDATNKITDFTAGGLSAPVDWTKLHTGVTWPSCDAYVQVQKAKFVPVFGHGKRDSSYVWARTRSTRFRLRHRWACRARDPEKAHRSLRRRRPLSTRRALSGAVFTGCSRTGRTSISSPARFQYLP